MEFPEKRAHYDVVVLGTGPAGLCATQALAVAGLRVAAISPAPASPWPQTFGVWEDEITPLGLDPFVGESYAQMGLRLCATRAHTLHRKYQLIDNKRLFEHLRDQADAAGATFCAGHAARVHREDSTFQVRCEEGFSTSAWGVLDARGHFSYPTGARGALAQTAFGVFQKQNGSPQPTPWLMDFSDAPGADPRKPTFLYTLPLRDGRTLYEETCLARAPAIPITELQTRLADRLGLPEIREADGETERVWIPMDPPIPQMPEGTIPLGARAGLVNPLSGYLFPAALRHARDVAEQVVEAHRRQDDFERVRLQIHDTTWTKERRLGRALRRFGIDVLANLDLDETRTFMDALFCASPNGWQAFLSHKSRNSDLIRAMFSTFQTLPIRLRFKATTRLSRHLDLLLHLSRGQRFWGGAT